MGAGCGILPLATPKLGTSCSAVDAHNLLSTQHLTFTSLVFIRINSTNDLDYPSWWNALVRADKNRLFYKSSSDCCMDHFSDDINCQIVDVCEDDDDGITSYAAAATISESSQRDSKISTPSAAATTNISRCNQWVPSKTEPGSCTNQILPDVELWPSSMFRSTPDECCRDFFKLTSCSIVDVCREL